MGVLSCCEQINCVEVIGATSVETCGPFGPALSDAFFTLADSYALAQDADYLYSISNSGVSAGGQVSRTPKANFSLAQTQTLILPAIAGFVTSIQVDATHTWISLFRFGGQVFLYRVLNSDWTTVTTFGFGAVGTNSTPVRILLDPVDANKIWMSCDNAANAVVLEINKTTGAFNSYTMGVFHQMNMAQDSGFLYLSDFDSNTLVKFDKTTHAVTTAAYANPRRWIIGTSEADGNVYTANENNASVQVLKIQKANWTTMVNLLIGNRISSGRYYAMDPDVDTHVRVITQTFPLAALQILSVLLSNFATVTVKALNTASLGNSTRALLHDVSYWYAITGAPSLEVISRTIR